MKLKRILKFLLTLIFKQKPKLKNMATIKKISAIYNAIPFIVVEYEATSGANGKLYDDIDFNELGAFVSVMEQQQAALGKYVVSGKSTYTQNGKSFPAIVFETSAVPQLLSNEVNCPITLNGAGLTALDNNMTPVLYCVANGVTALKTYYKGAMFLVNLPILNVDGRGDVSQDYSFVPGEAGAVVVLGVPDFDNSKYLCVISFEEQPTSLAIANKTGVIELINNSSATLYFLNGSIVGPKSGIMVDSGSIAGNYMKATDNEVINISKANTPSLAQEVEIIMRDSLNNPIGVPGNIAAGAVGTAILTQPPIASLTVNDLP